jgi:MFS transporter, ACS family, hexuronate transporter
MSPSQPSNYRWFICALIFFATTINYVDRQILALLKPMLDKDIGWTNTQFGYLQSFFQGAYAIGLLWFGKYVDRVGVKKAYTVSIVGWSIAALLHAPVIYLIGKEMKVPAFLGWLSADSTKLVIPVALGAFIIARILLGLAEGGNFPAAVKATTQWFPRRERALANSIFNAGTNAGAMFAPFTIPLIAGIYGWHWTFILAGLIGFVWLLFWMPKYGNPESCKEVNAAELAIIQSDPPEPPGEPLPWSAVLKYPQAWSFITSKFLTDPVWWFFLSWLPDFFKKSRGLDIKQSWVHIVVIYGIITVLSIFGGWFTGYLIRQGWTTTKARKVGMVSFAVLVVPIMFATQLANWPAVLLIALAGSAHQAWSATIYTTVSDMFPKRAVATIIGIGGMAGAISGMVIQPVVGKMVDLHGKAAYPILFGFCSCAYIIAFIVSHLLAPKFEQVKMKDA